MFDKTAMLRRRDALAQGISRSQLHREFLPVLHGVQVHRPVSSAMPIARQAAAALVLPDGFAFNHLAALDIFDLPLPFGFTTRREVHAIIAPTANQIRRPQIRVQRRALAPDEITVVNGMPVTTPARTFAGLAEILDEAARRERGSASPAATRWQVKVAGRVAVASAHRRPRATAPDPERAHLR
jgi:hypothetical protein